MASKSNEKRGWYSRQEMAAIFDVTEQHFDRSIRPLIPASGVRTVKRRPRFHGRTAIDAITTPPAPTPAAPIAVTPTPPTADDEDVQYRRRKRELLELDLDERSKQLVKRSALAAALRAGIAALRATGDRLVRTFGNGAGEIYNEGINDFEATAQRALSETGKAAGDEGE